MNWKQHLIIGIGLGVVFAVIMHHYLGWYQATAVAVTQVIIVLGVSPLILDLDHRSGKLTSILIGMGLFMALAGLIGWALNTKMNFQLIGNIWQIPLAGGVILAFLTFITSSFVNHRGWFHSIPTCIIYGTVIFGLTGFKIDMGVLASVGCYSHLLADGIPMKVR